MNINLFEKYKPLTLAEIVGQEPIKKELKARWKTGTFQKHELHLGPSGIGKTTIATLNARRRICTDLQKNDKGYLEPCNKCEMCRTVEPFRPQSGEGASFARITKKGKDFKITDYQSGEIIGFENYKVFIIENSDFLFNSISEIYPRFLDFLDAVETSFIITSTYTGDIGEELMSRLKLYMYDHPSISEIVKRLRYILAAEDIKVLANNQDEFYSEVLPMIALDARCNIRQSIQNLEDCVYLNLWSFDEAAEFFQFDSNNKAS